MAVTVQMVMVKGGGDNGDGGATMAVVEGGGGNGEKVVAAIELILERQHK